MRTIQLTVVGSLGPDALDVLHDAGVRGTREQTVLAAAVRDQAALQGLLQRLGSLGLDLVELRTLEPGAGDVEIVVAGRVGGLLAHMLADTGVVAGGHATSYRLRDVDLAEALDRLAELDRPPQGGEARTALARQRGGPADDGRRPSGGETSMDVDEMGPIDYVVVEFPRDRMDGSAFPLLVDLVERGIIRVLDLAFLEKDDDGQVSGLELNDLDFDGEVDMTVFQGASSSLLDEDDLAEAAAALLPGRAAGVIVYENTWAAPFATALRRGGAQLVASGRIPVQALLASLDATDAA